MQGLLQQVRPLPHNALDFKGNFQECDNDPCTRSYCTYAHGDLELQAWNKQKKDILDRKLKVIAIGYIICHVCIVYS